MLLLFCRIASTTQCNACRTCPSSAQLILPFLSPSYPIPALLLLFPHTTPLNPLSQPHPDPSPHPSTTPHKIPSVQQEAGWGVWNPYLSPSTPSPTHSPSRKIQQDILAYSIHLHTPPEPAKASQCTREITINIYLSLKLNLTYLTLTKSYGNLHITGS